MGSTGLDEIDCLAAIRRSYYDSASFDENEENYDEEEKKQQDDVEQKLLELVKKDDEIDGDEASAKARQCSMLKPPPEVDVGKMFQSEHAFPCSDTYKILPAHPSRWPQSPLMIRPTPHTSTKIRGIRRAGASPGDYEPFSGFCAGCILPINSGGEEEGNSLVIDFESPHFVGTMLMRIKQAKENKRNTRYSTQSYFDSKKRKFQAIVRGRFKTPLPVSQCVTGQSFDRPAGKLPARWIVTSFIKFVSTLAPQLEANLDGNKPRFLTPLAATAHTVLEREFKGDDIKDLEEEVEEPGSRHGESLLNRTRTVLGVKVSDTSKSSIGTRMKTRKKLMNQLAAKKNTKLEWDTKKEYSFEFYQHLLDFGDELAVDMGRPIGKVGLAQATDGQPIKFMSAFKDPASGDLDSLWSFDIWHSSLYPYAELATKIG